MATEALLWVWSHMTPFVTEHESVDAALIAAYEAWGDDGCSVHGVEVIVPGGENDWIEDDEAVSRGRDLAPDPVVETWDIMVEATVPHNDTKIIFPAAVGLYTAGQEAEARAKHEEMASLLGADRVRSVSYLGTPINWEKG